MVRNAPPIAIVPLAQLSEFALFGPLRSHSIAMLQDAAPQKTESARAGFTRWIPWVKNTLNWSSANPAPPSAEPTKHPMPSRFSSARSSRASSQAICAQATANCEYRSRRLQRLGSRYADGSKSRTSPPILQENGSGSNLVIRSTADRSRRSPSYKPWLPTPIGVTAPKPVTTTRRFTRHPGRCGRPASRRTTGGPCRLTQLPTTIVACMNGWIEQWYR